MELEGSLQRWLAATTGGVVEIHDVATPGAAGHSSETLLLSCSIGGVPSEYVVRRPPTADSHPLFPVYDFERQVAAMRLVRERTSVPVPEILWFEQDASVLGAPFFVMERRLGEPAADNPPYVLGGWLAEAPVEVQAGVSRSCIEILAGVHGITDPTDLGPFELPGPGRTPLRRHVDHTRAHYEWAVEGTRRVPLVESTFDWIEANWPEEPSAALSWGDARPANILWLDGAPTAVIDWESVAVAPPEVDLGWMLFFHRYFEDLAERLHRPGMPHFLRRDDVTAQYEKLTGHRPVDLDWFHTYAALRQSIVSIRVVGRRAVRGEASLPDEPDDMVFLRRLVERALDDPAATWR